ncbi:transcriptional regulator GcvA [Parasulfitobacter algicola]|uniref:Transcriptional regulator GcvA n=1 Tax=Parasulfitobacter algicola TaxID=2614809 RepID=A0ABX2ILS8_9RHOB|nr:transcriptional regulator GcvA [Sulfitobacter algicola]NSX53838.1 transcriptional regulator GcvA [Sulfitobacter algicola]
MTDRLPPLTALRAFDAAARHMSFAKAAAELNITPAALSFQIKSLEEHLGQPVFRRLNRAVELTEAGRTLAPGAADGFATLTTAWRNTRRLQDNTTLTVTAGPAFTAKWLAPRLYDFAQDHPEIELRLSASLRIMDFTRDEIDVAIRFGYGPDDGLFSQRLADEWMTPVMTPELAKQVKTPLDLAEITLLHDDSIRFLKPSCDWAAWFKAVDVNVDSSHGPRFSQADHAIDAALTGTGAVLARISLSHKELYDGRLVAPFATALTTKAHFRFICPKGAETRPQIKAFLVWIMKEAEKTRSFEEGRNFIASEDIQG